MQGSAFVLYEICTALERKRKEAAFGLSEPDENLVTFYKELPEFGTSLRHPEHINEISDKEVSKHVLNFFAAARKIARQQTSEPLKMYIITKNIMRDLSLDGLVLRELWKFFPKRTAHLFHILVALDEKIYRCNSGASKINPEIERYFHDLSKDFLTILDPLAHKNISDEMHENMIDKFFSAIKFSAQSGEEESNVHTNAIAILNSLGLSELIPKVARYIPERDKKGFFITVKKRA